jgi:RND family efflux transporter MFP subunit
MMHRQLPASFLRLLGMLGILGILGFMAGCSAGESAENATQSEPPRNVRVLELGTRALEEYLSLSGPLRPISATDVSSEEAGTIQAILKDKGAQVPEGEPIVMLDRGLLAAELAAAEADRELKAYNEERTRALFEDDSVSKQEMLLTHTQLEQAKAQEEMARLRFDRAAIKAPFTGVVSDRYVEPGELVVPGQRVARVVDPFTLELVGGVSDREVAYLKPGAPALVSVEGSPDLAEGRVHWVGLEASPTTGKFEVEIRLDNPGLYYRPGVVARARVLKTIHPDAVVIPRDAVVQTPGRHSVFVVEGDRAHEREVELGPDQGLMVRVESGLDAGELLVVRGQRELHDGSKVSIQERATSPDGSLPSDPDVVKQDPAGADEDLVPADTQERALGAK